LLVEMPIVPVTRLLGPLRLGLPMEKRLPERYVPLLPGPAGVLLAALLGLTAFAMQRGCRGRR